MVGDCSVGAVARGVRECRPSVASHPGSGSARSEGTRDKLGAGQAWLHTLEWVIGVAAEEGQVGRMGRRVGADVRGEQRSGCGLARPFCTASMATHTRQPPSKHPWPHTPDNLPPGFNLPSLQASPSKRPPAQSFT
eukprot:67944-Chlamydomonas_euryale.AAC.1